MLLGLILNIFFLGNWQFPAEPSWLGEKFLAKPEYYIEQRAIVVPKKIPNNSLGIKTTAKSVLVRDEASGKILFEKNPGERLPLASLTKLMTALVLLENYPEWDKEVTYLPEDEEEGDKLHNYRGETVTVRELWNIGLVASSNNAIAALVRSTGMSRDAFVALMNKKAEENNLLSTKFFDPIGLDSRNISNVYDISELLKLALGKKEILEALQKTSYAFVSKNKDKGHIVYNTDQLLGSYLNIFAGKTGFTDEAGYNMAIEAVGDQKQKIIIVLFGSQTSETRFGEVKGLASWALENYIW